MVIHSTGDYTACSDERRALKEASDGVRFFLGWAWVVCEHVPYSKTHDVVVFLLRIGAADSSCASRLELSMRDRSDAYRCREVYFGFAIRCR